MRWVSSQPVAKITIDPVLMFHHNIVIFKSQPHTQGMGVRAGLAGPAANVCVHETVSKHEIVPGHIAVLCV